MKDSNTSRVGVFIDGAYLVNVQKSLGRTPGICFRTMLSALVGDRTLVSANLYDTLPPPVRQGDPSIERKQRFFHALRTTCGFDVKVGRITQINRSEPRPVFIQKEVDTWLATDLAIHGARNKIDVAVVIAGDSDFLPPVRAVLGLGVEVELWHGTNNVSRELLQAVSRDITLTTAHFDSWHRDSSALSPHVVTAETLPDPPAEIIVPARLLVNNAISSDGFLVVEPGKPVVARPGERLKVLAGAQAFVPPGAYAWVLNGGCVHSQPGAICRLNPRAQKSDWDGSPPAP